MTPKEIGKRLFWTVVAAGLGSLATAKALNLDALQVALQVAVIAAINYMTLIARSKAQAISEARPDQSHPPAPGP